MWVYQWVYARVAYLDGYMCECIRCACIDSLSALCVSLQFTAFQTRSDDPNSVTGDSDLYPFWTRCSGDSKTDPWDDP